MKCSNHTDTDAVAICESCNLFYCGSCAISSNGKCPKCGNSLSSLSSVMSYEISQEELYRGKGQPRILEALKSLYMEPVRAIRRLKEYPSIPAAVLNLILSYFLILILWILFLVTIALLPNIFHINEQPDLFGLKSIFTSLMVSILYFGFFILAWLFVSSIYFLPAKLLGGKGGYIQQACLLSYIMLAILPLWVLWIFAILLGTVPVAGQLIALVITLAVLLYTLFIIFLNIREVNEFHNIKTAISLVISLAIFALLAFLLLRFWCSSLQCQSSEIYPIQVFKYYAF